MVPWYSGISGDAPVLGKADADKVRKMREEFEGASAEYRVLSQVALAGLTSEGESLQKRFKDLEQAWGAFQWNQKTGHTDVISTRQEVQAASAALSGHGVGLDLEQEVETVLAELWDTLERPPAKPVKEAEEPLVAEELDRLEAFIEARIHEEERLEQQRRHEQGQAQREKAAKQSEVLDDMSAKFQSSHPAGLDEGTGGTPMTSANAPEEVPVLPGSGQWFDKEVRHLSREVNSVSEKLNKDRRPRRGGASWMGDLAGGGGPSLPDGEWNVFTPARPMEARARPARR